MKKEDSAAARARRRDAEISRAAERNSTPRDVAGIGIETIAPPAIDVAVPSASRHGKELTVVGQFEGLGVFLRSDADLVQALRM
jgi:hypothetical protein